MGENDISKIIDMIAHRIISGRRKMSEVKRVELDIVGVDSPHGIYIYDRTRDKWILVRSEGEEFKPERDGVYVIYFDNTMCPACRIYDLSWYPYVKIAGRQLEDVYYVIILCDWFAHRCRSEAAKKSFQKYDIHASPTTLLLCVKNGKIIREERIEGAKKLEYLVDIVEKFVNKCRRDET